MRRYFFHVSKPGLIDDVGEDFPTAAHARAQAVRVAKELEGTSLAGLAVCVADQDGNEIARVPIPFEVADHLPLNSARSRADTVT
jgi:hypothetical protein